MTQLLRLIDHPFAGHLSKRFGGFAGCAGKPDARFAAVRFGLQPRFAPQFDRRTRQRFDVGGSENVANALRDHFTRSVHTQLAVARETLGLVPRAADFKSLLSVASFRRAKAIEAEESTHARYNRVVERFTGFLGEAKSKRDLSTLQASDIARFRDRESKERARATANLSLKVLRVCSAKPEGLAGMSWRSRAARLAHNQSCCACEAPQIEQGIQAATVLFIGNQMHPESVR